MAQLPPELFGTVGGNTTCLEIDGSPSEVIVVDAGTGLRELGLAQATVVGGVHYHIFLTHFHWDHLQGLPFFSGFHHPDNQVTLYSPVPGFEALVRDQMRDPYFPVTLSSFPAQIRFVELAPNEITVAGTQVRWTAVRHPGQCIAYRFERAGQSLVFSTDSELHTEDFPPNEEMGSFFGGVHTMVLDAQYTLREVLDRPNWGHSASTDAVDFALEFGARELYLFHHEPTHDDAMVEEIGRVAQWYADNKQSAALRVCIAKEGTEGKIE